MVDVVIVMVGVYKRIIFIIWQLQGDRDLEYGNVCNDRELEERRLDCVPAR